MPKLGEDFVYFSPPSKTTEVNADTPDAVCVEWTREQLRSQDITRLQNKEGWYSDYCECRLGVSTPLLRNDVRSWYLAMIDGHRCRLHLMVMTNDQANENTATVNK